MPNRPVWAPSAAPSSASRLAPLQADVDGVRLSAPAEPVLTSGGADPTLAAVAHRRQSPATIDPNRSAGVSDAQERTRPVHRRPAFRPTPPRRGNDRRARATPGRRSPVARFGTGGGGRASRSAGT